MLLHNHHLPKRLFILNRFLGGKEFIKMKNKIQKRIEHYRRLAERYGLGSLEGGIFEAVIAFRACGFPTSGSCEGHLGHGSVSPWVDFTPARCKITDETVRRLDPGIRDRCL